MAQDYKLCPNCKNALDKNENKCPYCRQQILWLDLPNWKDFIINNLWNLKKSTDKKKTSGCGIFILIIIAIQIIWVVLWFITEIISSIF
jgi:RNA polymerase subunit RPABC4/transcription elongation factor Spt4